MQRGVELIVEHRIAAPWRTSGSVNLYVNDIDALETMLLFPTPRPLPLAASREDTCDFTVSNRFQAPPAANSNSA